MQSISAEAVLSLEDRSESYSLAVPADGSEATLTADSTLGLLRGKHPLFFSFFLSWLKKRQGLKIDTM